MLNRHPLSSGWTGRLAAGGPAAPDARLEQFPATVPGSVHADLQAAGIIPDPFDGDNEHALRWIGDADWSFRTTFDAPATGFDRTDLVLEGVDTVARVVLNGQELARTENMHRTYRLPVALRDTGNVLEVHITSPRRFGAERRDSFGKRPSAFSDVAPFIRKMACDFGWDWGPDLATSGLWRPVAIENWSTARIASARPIVTIDGETGVVDLVLDVERVGERGDLAVRVGVGDLVVDAALASDADSTVVRVEVPSVERWWPRGLGEQSLYPVAVTLLADGQPLDEWSSRIGFREIVVEQPEDPDGDGSAFRLVVNGEPLFVRGVNWIPDSSLVATVTREQYATRLRQATELGANLIRVWGGGCFGTDDFYEECDEQGLLVWQDFLFACAAYPEEGPYAAEIEAEARDNIARIMPHPSLALWNGNNENVWFWFIHDWETVLEGKTWGEKYYFDLLPSLVAELDPQRFYLAGSPYSGARDRQPNDPARGVVHSWIPGDYREYREIAPRFVSEFGFQGPPSRALFDSVVHEADPQPFSPGVVQRQKAVYGTERIEDVLRVHLGIPTDFDEWYWLAELNQARAVGFGIDYFRSLSPWCRGTVVWQLNDCWPVISWSVLDSGGRWKLAAYAMRRAFADRVATVQVVDGQARASFGNEAREAWVGAARVERWTASGRVSESSVDVAVDPHDTQWVDLGSVGLDEFVVVTAGGIRATALGGVDLDFPDAPAEFEVHVQPSSDGVSITVRAASLLRDTCLAVGALDADAHADRNLVTLLPGETETWSITTRHPERFTAESARGVVRTARAATTR
ncbi:glycoside hydrolase family 2 protein [Schumannella luteola]